MNLELEQIVVDNVFTQDQISRIYKYVDSCPKDKVVDNTNQGQKLFFIKEFDEIDGGARDIWETIEEHVSNVAGKKMKLRALQFCRYTLETGVVPELFPHVDTAFPKPVFTFDIQMASSFEWPIYVSNKKYVLKDNQALTFSGTHQVHWRDKVDFESYSFLDMVFAHLEDPLAEDITDTHRLNMRRLVNYYKTLYYERNQNVNS
jgi:hypothetical protein